MTPGGGGLLLARPLPCAVARTHALQQTACAESERQRFRGTGVTEYWIRPASVPLDARRPDHLAPFLGFLRNEFPDRRCQRDQACVHPAIRDG